MNAAPADPLIGTLIDGRYRIERLVGVGGFGSVFRAFHVGLGSPVALKVLKLPRELGPDQLAKLCGGFFDEARTLKLLRHPNIIAALDVGLLTSGEDGLQLPYLVMEWCDGVTLKEHLKARGQLSLRDAWQLFEPLLDAMAHAHREKVAHRDLKPANVLVEISPTGEPRPRVVDFGIAKIVAPGDAAGTGDTLTVSGSSPFTPRYAAPEQLVAARTGPWTDVHALALLFVEMVTGEPAFGDDENAMFAVFDPVRPTPITMGVDVGGFEPILTSALSVRPAERYPDAGALAIAMRHVAAGGLSEYVAPRTPVGAHARVQVNVAAQPPARPHFDANRSAPSAGSSQSTSGSRFAMIDQTAAPSSRTLRTFHPSGPPKSSTASGARARVFGAIALGTLVVATTASAGVQRYRHAWPFPTPAHSQAEPAEEAPTPSAKPNQKPRLRDLTTAEIDRRVNAAGLGTCTPFGNAEMHVLSCDKSLVLVEHVGLASASIAEVRTFINNSAAGYAKSYGACLFAIDGNVALLLGASPTLVDKTFDTLLEGVTVDARDKGHTLDQPPELRRAEAGVQLGAWNGNDLWASVAKLGGTITFADPNSKTPNTIMVDQDKDNLAIYLFQGNGKGVFEAYKTNKALGTFAYALDGDNFLVVTGSPKHATVAYVRKLLDGARAADVGVITPH